MTSRIRHPVSNALRFEVLYEAARTCCVCRIPGLPVEIHHIDQDPSNNSIDNLVVICRNCHDEAHTKHSMSQNLTASQLKHAKKKWGNEVSRRSASAMLPGSNLRQAMWTYINHEKLPRLMKSHNVKFDSWAFENLYERKLIDKNGVPIFQREAPGSWLATIYDRFAWDASQQIHNMYMTAVDDLILATNPLELGALWSRTGFKNLVKPGSLCFAIRGFKFRSAEVIDREENRLVHARANGIEVRFYANTRHMFGSSALHTNFVGSSFAAVLLLAKRIEIEEGKLVLHATPMAMGAGFLPSAYQSPHKLRYGWASNQRAERDYQVEISDDELDKLW
ncbi:HNH endonuclease signature motif containing protein [Massilia sp. BHUDP2]|uniref:HNH endonuclease signature motif containing protein n=1 Tax=Massilia sp. BHUDP2 TaxID=3034505 RepID=UPI003905EFDE